MSLLIVTRGLPACGKTTKAQSWVAVNPEQRCRVNRDDFRMMFHDKRRTGLQKCERAVTEAQYPAIRALLSAGFDVVSDDTWLDEQQFQQIKALAADVEAQFLVWDMRDVPPCVCIQRDKDRGSLVGADVIAELHRRHIS